MQSLISALVWEPIIQSQPGAWHYLKITYVDRDVGVQKDAWSNLRDIKCKHEFCVSTTHTCGCCVNVQCYVIRNTQESGVYL